MSFSYKGDGASDIDRGDYANDQSSTPTRSSLSSTTTLYENSAFLTFEARVQALSQGLLDIRNVSHTVGSTSALLKVADHLRYDLQLVYDLLVRMESSYFQGTKGYSSYLMNNPLFIEEQRQHAAEVEDVGDISEGLEILGGSIKSLLGSINDVSDFSEERVNIALGRGSQEILYRADSLTLFRDRLHEPDIIAYVNDVVRLLNEQFEPITRALESFVSQGVPMIQAEQDKSGRAYQNLSTTSALLSSVTASAIQYTLSYQEGTLARTTNTLWIISLCFSIASALHSQLAYYWIGHIHRTPALKLSVLGSILIARAPLLFFVVSTIAFSGGLIAFSFLNFGAMGIGAVAISCTSVTLGTMCLAVAWLVQEKFEYFLSKIAHGLQGLRQAFRSRPAISRVFEWDASTANSTDEKQLESGIVYRDNAPSSLMPSNILGFRVPSMASASISAIAPSLNSLPSPSSLHTGAAGASLLSSARAARVQKAAISSAISSPSLPSLRFRGARRTPPSWVQSLKEMSEAARVYLHSSPVEDLLFSPDGAFLISRDRGNRFNIFEIHPTLDIDPTPITKWEQSGRALHIAWRPYSSEDDASTRNIFATVYSDRVTLWQIRGEVCRTRGSA
ncbi:hypothetical protein DL93DRAFT_1709821 [Clavulina sp. PMI_390]|nr:hypothetical protein DL93DRAFT_1709821 [Clavulina sp. PMI_390]